MPTQELERAWDEAYAAPGVPREAYAELLDALDGVDLRALRAEVQRRVDAVGATFGPERFGVDPVPRIVPAEEWRELAAGLAQRVRALNAFVLDAYGERRIVAAGAMSDRVLDEAEGYEPELRGRLPRHAAPIGVAGLDVVREPGGRLVVLEDNLRMPSGIAYAVAARGALRGVLPLGEPAGLQDLAGAVRPALARTLADAAPPRAREAPHAVLLSEGPAASTWFEHATLAHWLRIPVVTLGDLRVAGGDVVADLPDGPTRVDVIYRRDAGDGLRDARGEPTPIARLLLEPWLAGRVGLVNGFGTGVADDKLAHAHVEDMIRLYLGEEPLLRSVPTLDLGEPGVAQLVIDDPRRYVVKPRHGEGGRGVVVCAHAVEEDVRTIVEEIRRAPERWIAQETVALSRHPTVIDGSLAPRHVDLRPFVFSTEAGATPVPGGLTRVAWDAGALVVNSSQQGGAKDTWVLR